jgi:site-specific recombinase XerD
MVALTGKGRKTRHVPIDANTTALLSAYLTERRLRDPGRDGHPVFYNQHRQKLSRGAIAWILRKYQARATDPALAGAQLSPHVLRHYVDGWVMLPAGVFPLLMGVLGLVAAT